MRRLAGIGCIAVAVAAAGCGGGSRVVASTARATTSDRASTQANLERGVRAALEQNFKLSLYVLWHNEVPSWAPRSTRGPALAELRTSAATRSSRGIRIRSVKTALRIETIHIDPSFMTATAVAEGKQRVRPYESGIAQARVVSLDERARFTLRRLASSQHFVVWKVAPIR
jgi:hypothetical protein